MFVGLHLQFNKSVAAVADNAMLLTNGSFDIRQVGGRAGWYGRRQKWCCARSGHHMWRFCPVPAKTPRCAFPIDSGSGLLEEHSCLSWGWSLTAMCAIVAATKQALHPDAQQKSTSLVSWACSCIWVWVLSNLGAVQRKARGDRPCCLVWVAGPLTSVVTYYCARLSVRVAEPVQYVLGSEERSRKIQPRGADGQFGIDSRSLWCRAWGGAAGRGADVFEYCCRARPHAGKRCVSSFLVASWNSRHPLCSFAHGPGAPVPVLARDL